MKVHLAHIVAATDAGVIGLNGVLPWHIPEDLQFFRQTTQNHVLIMGRKTFESIGHPLPKRFSVVISRQKDLRLDKQNKSTLCVTSLDEAIEQAQILNNSIYQKNTIFILGGGQIFSSTFDKVDRIYLTRIHESFEGDCFYPFPSQDFRLVKKRKGSGPHNLTFQVFERQPNP